MLDYVIETFYPEIHQNHSNRTERNTAFFREVDRDLFITFNNSSAAAVVLIHWNTRPFYLFLVPAVACWSSIIFLSSMTLFTFGRLPSLDLASYPLRVHLNQLPYSVVRALIRESVILRAGLFTESFQYTGTFAPCKIPQYTAKTREHRHSLLLP